MNVNLLHQCLQRRETFYKPCRAMIYKLYLGNCRVLYCQLKQTRSHQQEKYKNA